jgi:hypothetical protein
MLQKLAENGPIVVYNVSVIRSDAFIITSEGIELLPLPSLTEETLLSTIKSFNQAVSDVTKDNISAKNEKFSGFLAWLWVNTVKPVLKKLKLLPPKSGPLPRIWWVPSGPLVLAPMHAAGHHHRGSVANTMSCVISSYTPSLKALSYSRREKSFLKSAKPSMLVVGVESIPGRPELDLPWVEQDMKHIKTATAQRVAFERLENPDPISVLQKLGSFDIAHFSCHGDVNMQMPMKSGLILCGGDKGYLSVGDLINYKLDKAQLAVLAACSTGQITNPLLYQESVHVVSGFALAGFIHVVGSLWSVNDRVSATFDSLFYKNLLAAIELNSFGVDHEVVAKAYHDAVLELKISKDYYESLCIIWAPYIHVGA